MVQSHRRPIIHRSVHIFHIQWKACLCFILAVQDAMEGCWEHDFLSKLQLWTNAVWTKDVHTADGVTITGNDESRIFELYHSVLHGLFIGSYCPIDLKCSQHCLWSCQWPRQHHCDLIDHPCKTAWIGSLTFLTAAYRAFYALSAHCFTSYLSTNKPLINPLYPHYAPLSSRGAWLVDL